MFYFGVLKPTLEKAIVIFEISIFEFVKMQSFMVPWCSGYHTAQLHSTKPELRFCVGSNPARGVSEIRDGEDL